VSGEIPVVTLFGAEASRLIVALQWLAADAPPFTLVGGLAVLARLASVNPYRATRDLDAVQRSLLIYSSATPQPPFADDLIFVGERLIAGLQAA
jgi:hypothetical protein